MNITRKKVLVFSITIIMMILFSKIFGYANENFAPKFGISNEKINFRKAANLNSSSIVKTINKNTSFNVLGAIDNFYIIQLESNEVGLVSKDYTEITSETSKNNQNYQNLDKFYATISENIVNLRSGPGTNFGIYKKLYKGNSVEIIGKINDWYLVTTKDNYVGMIREDLILKSDDDTINDDTTSSLPNTAETVLTLINNEREKNGLPALKIYDLLNSTAQAKAKDMVTNNYFAHESPTYGSPFNMMKNAGITYKTAGENIAGNPSVEKAVNSWLASESHKANILSNAYNFVGIGIEESETYGYVIVVMFIGK